jgi:hypothetical protein
VNPFTVPTVSRIDWPAPRTWLINQKAENHTEIRTKFSKGFYYLSQFRASLLSNVNLIGFWLIFNFCCKFVHVIGRWVTLGDTGSRLCTKLSSLCTCHYQRLGNRITSSPSSISNHVFYAYSRASTHGPRILQINPIDRGGAAALNHASPCD